MHSGADRTFQVDHDIDRGIRSPRHLGFLGELGIRVIQPFMAAPVRPGETIVGMSYNANMWQRAMINLHQRPFVAAEIAYWVIPIATLDRFFRDLVVGSPQDLMERGTEAAAIGGTTARTADDPVTGHGHLTPGLHRIARQWAGEIGGNVAGAGVVGSEYAPYVSYGTWKVAEDWYALDLPASAYYENPALFDNPPAVGPYIRSALRMGFDAGTPSVDPDPSGTTSLADMLEQLFLLTREEKTYAEYLSRHGVNPREVEGMAMPLVIDHFNFRPLGSGQAMGSFLPLDDAAGIDPPSPIEGTEPQESWVLDDVGASEFRYFGDRGMYGTYGASRQGYRRRNLRVEEPSILLGTVVAWREQGVLSQYSHIFDMTRMVHPGHWGDRGIGGVEEEDFLAVQDVYSIDGTTVQEGAGQDQSGSQMVFNLLNLYLHGEVNNMGRNANDDDGLRTFDDFGPGGFEWSETNGDINGHIQTQLHILSDLVG